LRKHSPLVVVALALALPLLLFGIVVAARSSGDRLLFLAADRSSYRGSEPPAGIRLKPFALTSYRGSELASSTLRGKVVALTFLDSNCKESCPIIAVVLARGIDRLRPKEREQVRAIAISTQPIDDKPQNVRRFLEKRRALGRLDYLVGTEAELRPVWRRYDILSALDSGDADTHSASVHIYDRNGVWVSSLHPGVDLTPENLVHDLRRALNDS
jgi:cytochrome oxidase Cu insertion factor (SCO1/SenC/PrrC family)